MISSLINVELDITRECNFHCNSCMRFSNIYNKNSKSIMNLDDIHHIFSQVYKHISINTLRIIGGEPTLHPQFKDILTYILSTNIANNFLLETNHSNLSMLKWCKLLPKLSIHQLENDISNSLTQSQYIAYLQNLKNKKHINSYGLKKLNNIQNIDISKCEVLNGCGINIYKFNNKIRFAPCNWSVFISRLLMKEDQYTYETLEECLKYDKVDLKNDVCCYCLVAHYLNNEFTHTDFTGFQDFSIINSDFIAGYQHIVNNYKMYN